MVSTQKKPTTVSPNVPSVPPIPARDLLSQPSGEGQIEEIIEPSPDHENRRSATKSGTYHRSQ